MPQRHYNIGSSLGQALGGALSDDSYNKGVREGETILARRAQAEKYLVDADAQRRQNELQSDDSILATALQSAGISSADMPKFKNYMNYGTIAEPAKPQTGIDIQSVLGNALKTGTPTEDHSAFIEPKPIAIAPDMSPKQRQQYDLALRTIASMRQALTQGDKNTTSATETALANLRASGAGNNDTTLAQLLLHGKPQFDAQATGATDVLTGDQVLNEIGRSQIVENNAQAQKAATGKAPSDEFKAVRDDIRSDFNATYPISSLNGKRPKDAPDFNTFTRDWLRQYNIPEQAFFNEGNPVAVAATPSASMAPVAFAPPAQRFTNDPAMKGNKAGKMVDGKGIEVFNASGKLIGYYK